MNTSTFHRLMIVGLLCGLFGWDPAPQDADPLVGTWVLNVAKSHFSPGWAPQSETRTFVMEGEQTKLTTKNAAEPHTYLTVHHEIKATSIGVDRDGKLTERAWTIVYDGRDRPMTGDPDADMLSTRRVDPLRSEFTKKRAGQAVITGTCAISGDGRTMTIVSKGINAKGQTIDDVAVFDKQ